MSILINHELQKKKCYSELKIIIKRINFKEGEKE